MKTLLFEGAGWDFYKEAAAQSDVGNFRLRTIFVNNNKQKIYFECGNGAHRILRGGKYVVDSEFYLWIYNAFYVTGNGDDENKSTILPRNTPANMPYSKENVINFVNTTFDCDFDSMEVAGMFDDYIVDWDGYSGNVQPGNIDERLRTRRKAAFDKADKKYREHCNDKYTVLSIVSMNNTEMRLKCSASNENLGEWPREFSVSTTSL